MEVTGLEIRPYRESDEEAVASLWREVFWDAPAWNVPEEDIRRKIEIQRELFLVATEGDQLVGTAMGGYDGHRGWVYYVAVSPKHRRRGIGAALMQGVEDGLVAMGCPKLNLQVRADNRGALSFYRSLGYVLEGRASFGKQLRRPKGETDADGK